QHPRDNDPHEREHDQDRAENRTERARYTLIYLWAGRLKRRRGGSASEVRIRYCGNSCKYRRQYDDPDGDEQSWVRGPVTKERIRVGDERGYPRRRIGTHGSVSAFGRHDIIHRERRSDYAKRRRRKVSAPQS